MLSGEQSEEHVFAVIRNGCVQAAPAVTVLGVDVRPGDEQLFHHLHPKERLCIIMVVSHGRGITPRTAAVGGIRGEHILRGEVDAKRARAVPESASYLRINVAVRIFSMSSHCIHPELRLLSTCSLSRRHVDLTQSALSTKITLLPPPMAIERI